MKPAEFEQSVVANIEAELASRSVDGQQVSGVIDWLALVGVLIDTLIPMLNTCFKTNSKTEIAAKLIEGGAHTRKAARAAVMKSRRKFLSDNEDVVVNAIVKSCKALTIDDAEQLVSGANDDQMEIIVNWEWSVTGGKQQ